MFKEILLPRADSLHGHRKAVPIVSHSSYAQNYTCAVETKKERLLCFVRLASLLRMAVPIVGGNRHDVVDVDI